MIPPKERAQSVKNRLTESTVLASETPEGVVKRRIMQWRASHGMGKFV